MKTKWTKGKQGQPREVLSVYDNGGQTMDRYTVVLREKGERPGEKAMIALSEVQGPQGVSMYTSAPVGSHLGRKIAWSSLPPQVRASALGWIRRAGPTSPSAAEGPRMGRGIVVRRRQGVVRVTGTGSHAQIEAANRRGRALAARKGDRIAVDLRDLEGKLIYGYSERITLAPGRTGRARWDGRGYACGHFYSEDGSEWRDDRTGRLSAPRGPIRLVGGPCDGEVVE